MRILQTIEIKFCAIIYFMFSACIKVYTYLYSTEDVNCREVLIVSYLFSWRLPRMFRSAFLTFRNFCIEVCLWWIFFSLWPQWLKKYALFFTRSSAIPRNFFWVYLSRSSRPLESKCARLSCYCFSLCRQVKCTFSCDFRTTLFSHLFIKLF